MNCPSVDSLFLRANGDFVCWDDAGSDKVLQSFDSNSDVCTVFTDSGPLSTIYENLCENTFPFPEICTSCYCLSMKGSPRSRAKWLNTLQVEPSSSCTLRCKACATPEERERLRLPHIMPFSIFNKVISDFVKSGIDIGLFDFSGHGEPMMNPELWKMISFARKQYPEAVISLITNGHGNFKKEDLLSGLDRIQFSIDGVDQESYERYRVGGDFAKASGYMREFAREAKSSKSSVQVIWRYILFEHNDKPEQIKKAYEMASEFGVNELRFIFTHQGMWSTDIPTPLELKKKLLELGIPFKNIKLDTHSFQQSRRYLSQSLKCNKTLYRKARKFWTLLKRGSNSRTIITSDFYQLRENDLLKALGFCNSLLNKNQIEEAKIFFRYVNNMIHFPAANNEKYNPEIVKHRLGDAYTKLEKSLNQSLIQEELL